MEVYVEKESEWLDAQSAHINSWDFQLFEPWYIKQAGDYQLKMYEAYRANCGERVGPDSEVKIFSFKCKKV